MNKLISVLLLLTSVNAFAGVACWENGTRLNPDPETCTGANRSTTAPAPQDQAPQAATGTRPCYKIVNSRTETRQVPRGESCPSGYEESEESAREARDVARSGASALARSCFNTLKTARNKYDAAFRAVPPNPAHPDILALTTNVTPEVSECRAMELVARSYNRNLSATAEEKNTTDGIATCRLKAGYTTDYDSCTSTATIYNTIVGIETVMLATQQLRNTNNQQNIQAKAAAQSSTGDGQNALYDASLADYSFKKGLNQEQIMAYSVAITALGAKIATWKSGCGSKPASGGLAPSSNLPAGSCAEVLDTAKDLDGRAVVANNDAKAAFSQAMMRFLTKLAAAKAALDALNRNTAVVQAAKNQTTTPDGAPVFEKCVVSPLDPECIQRSGRSSAAGFSQGDFSAGEGFGNNSFDLGAGAGDAVAEDVAGSAGDGNGAVSGVASPFGEAAKNANDILDPAAAASISPGGGSGGGGGGVGGGLGGGGGASLGNDLQGENKDNKAKDIEANKLAGNYNSVGGKGFSAVAGGKEDNPFKDLFDSKSAGGIEEDRSIASDDGGKDSGLFQRISSRMGQVVADKRIEANNLE